MQKTIYKSAAAKQRILALYQEKLDSLAISYEEKQVDTFAGKTTIIITGEKGLPPVVLLHGVNVGTPIALEAVKGLSKKFRIYGIDLVGQPNRSAETRLPLKDDSYGKWLVAVYDALGIKKAPVIGISYGGFIVQRLIAYAPERIDRVIFVVPAGFTNGSPLKAIFKVLIPMRRYLKSNKEEDLQSFLNAFCSDQDSYLMRYQEAVLKGVNMDMRRPPLLKKKEVENLEAPVYILAVRNDVFFPGDKIIKKAKKIFRNLKKTILLEEGKHVPAIKDYPKIEQIIQDFLDD